MIGLALSIVFHLFEQIFLALFSMFLDDIITE